jgi:hypothetical protein
MYPDEYDIYDQALEKSLKKNFGNKKGDDVECTNYIKKPGDEEKHTHTTLNWKVPDFSNEEKIL